MENTQPLSIELDYERRFSYAHYQNHIPFLRLLRIHNLLEDVYENLILLIQADLFDAENRIQISKIGANASCVFEKIQLNLKSRSLISQTERETGSIQIAIFQEDLKLVESSFSFELLAFNEWCGLASLPEILAAHVQPNHPSIDDFLREASQTLQARTGDSSLTGYQSRSSKRVYEMCEAIYDTMREGGASYIHPPASFENTGQKIRTPDQILHNRMGTCLDWAVFFASCLEQIGLHPLVVMIEGHAFAGVWLEETSFPHPCIDDPSYVRKNIELRRLIVFETTDVTKAGNYSWERAIEDATALLGDDSRFHFALDILNARRCHIHPLPNRIRSENGFQEVESSAGQPRVKIAYSEDAGKNAENLAPVKEPASPEIEPLKAPCDRLEESAPERIERWKRKLLDLSLRNRLLNFRETRKSFHFLCPNLGLLEDALSDGEGFAIHARSRFLREEDERDADLMRQSEGRDGLTEFLQTQMKQRRLYSDLEAEELSKRLLVIYREARVSLEEGGANTLYLALGFLKWFEAEGSDQPRMAPLVLVPLELQRKSIREGFRLSMLDDEPRFNVTLLQKLEKDYGLTIDGLDPLPTDDAGLDIDSIFKRVTEAILNQPRWEVLKEAFVGHFSFNKFLMWVDLETHFDTFLNQPVFKHLAEKSGQPFHDGIEFPESDRLDETHPPAAVFCPMDCDSSQLTSIIAAADGKNFVLEGPPGTGKSQTITNLIAHCLTLGKRVLFVSEKMAALNVVYDRLQQIGLGPFCLELHSNKADKRSVLAQLETVLGAMASESSGTWERETSRLQTLRDELNGYVQALAKRRPLGASAFQVISRLIGFRNKPFARFDFESILEWDENALWNRRDALSSLKTAVDALGFVHQHPWQAVQRTEWSPLLEETIHQEAGPILQSIDTVKSTLQEACEDLPYQSDTIRSQDFLTIKELADLFADEYIPTRSILEEPQWNSIQAQLLQWIALGKERDEKRAFVFQVFHKEILQCNLREILEKVKKAINSYPPFSWFHLWGVKKQLKPYTSVKIPSKNKLVELIESAIEINRLQDELTPIHKTANNHLGAVWNQGEADWNAVDHAMNWLDRFHQTLSKLPTHDDEAFLRFKRRWISLATEFRAKTKPGASLGSILSTLIDHYQLIRDRQRTLNDLLSLHEQKAWGGEEEDGWLITTQNTIDGWLQNPGALPKWLGYVRARRRSEEEGLHPLIHLLERDEVKAGELLSVFDHSFYREWYNALLNHEPVLRDFFSPDHMQTITQFQKIDRKVIELASTHARQELVKNIPQQNVLDLKTSELGILKAEIKKKRRHLPIRRLLNEIPALIQRLKPCFLMSPLSVSQFLDIDFPSFDLVIFDEASQIPVWDAVGAIGRGAQVIVVGDSKQLPPTNFFQILDSEDEFQDDFELVDMESILDHCSVAGLPNYDLKWHYRSRHETLIAFSNYHYYNNHLITFPSPQAETDGCGVDFHYLENGIYDKGKSRTNPIEAKAIVEEIVHRLTDPAAAQRSIGVVTFNLAQQQLIEDLLEQARRDHPAIDPFFSSESHEPVFVKNLENVQGDERDLILLSVCYGPDAQGRVSMNFGPLNREGGERRLNVAITRARYQVLLFSSIKSEQIDLKRTRARGAEHLKFYLDYAERGPNAIVEAIAVNPAADFDSPFEKDVFCALREKGWSIDIQVGCSGYRVDLAVRHPQKPGEFVLGIECDGANYHSSRVARDRDRIRESVLKRLGWTLYRIWSTDWRQNRENEIEKLHARILKAIADDSRRQKRKEPDPPAPKPIAAFVPEMQTPKIENTRESASEEEETNLLPGQEIYIPFEIPAAAHDKELFFESKSKSIIAKQIKEIVKAEGPVSFDLLAKYTAAQWNIERLTEKTKIRIEEVLKTLQYNQTLTGDRIFIWKPIQNPEQYESFRTPQEGRRDLAQIAKEEIANAIAALLAQHLSAQKEDVLKAVAKLFGYKSTSQKSLSILEIGLQHLVLKKQCMIEEDNVKWLE